MSLRSRLGLLEKRIPRRQRTGCVSCDAPGRRWARGLVLFEGDPERRCQCGRRLDKEGNPLGPGWATIVVVERPKAETTTS